MSQVFNLYCDESCHLEHDHLPVMVLGAVWCLQDKARETAVRLREIKRAHGLPADFELKWTKVSPAKLGYYMEVLYGWFTADFLKSLPRWPGKRVGLKRHPMSRGKDATFWHFISEGENEEDRLMDMRRCERIRWPRPTMEAFVDRRPAPGDRIVWWKNERRGEGRYLLALPDFSYLMVVADRGDYVLPWTQYHVDREHRREKYRKEYHVYWATQKS